jgi:hypothetical protein
MYLILIHASQPVDFFGIQHSERKEINKISTWCGKKYIFQTFQRIVISNPFKLDSSLAMAIQDVLSIPCRSDETIKELIRGVRFHFTKFVKPLANGLLEQSQLGLGHAYSRSKVIFVSLLAPVS